MPLHTSDVAGQVAERLGVRSLRRQMLAESAASMRLGMHTDDDASGAAEAFGQSEALTTRLKHIIQDYADGPGILLELLQNADDAAASEVAFLLDNTHYGTSSVLGERDAVQLPHCSPSLLVHQNGRAAQHTLAQ